MIKRQLALKSLGSFTLFFWNGLSSRETHTEQHKKVGNKWAITLEDRNISFEGEARRKTELLHNDKTLVKKRIHFLKGFIFFGVICNDDCHMKRVKVEHQRSLRGAELENCGHRPFVMKRGSVLRSNLAIYGFIF